ncbi:MAG TPA: glycosyltransferase, partial [Anaerolineae bacterium]|nr:glycosyltransferase [Anaerolineae bacterium]
LIYNCFDVLLSPSQAEGFGLPILEAQACGKPVVTLNTTSMPEIIFAGRCLEPVQPVWEPLGGWRGTAPVGDILDAIIWARDMAEGSEARKYLAEKARAGAEDFSWKAAVNDHLLPILAEIA